MLIEKSVFQKRREEEKSAKKQCEKGRKNTIHAVSISAERSKLLFILFKNSIKYNNYLSQLYILIVENIS